MCFKKSPLGDLGAKARNVLVFFQTLRSEPILVL
jgi:hypothetical protein